MLLVGGLGVWELSGATLGRKIAGKLSWQILVNFGQARIDENFAQMGQDGAKLGPRWRQDGPSWCQDGSKSAGRGCAWYVWPKEFPGNSISCRAFGPGRVRLGQAWEQEAQSSALLLLCRLLVFLFGLQFCLVENNIIDSVCMSYQFWQN